MNIGNILASIGIGLLATTSPCVFPLYPGYLAYLSASGDKSGGKKHQQVFSGFLCAIGRFGDDARDWERSFLRFPFPSGERWQ